MVAVLVEYIRSLNQFEIEVEVRSNRLLDFSFYIFDSIMVIDYFLFKFNLGTELCNFVFVMCT